ncbi:hypothetical protein M2167_003652 [Streptomyces sp. SPB4]|nr:hypothetical protein [Streptomyces sp. SPB4]
MEQLDAESRGAFGEQPLDVLLRYEAHLGGRSGVREVRVGLVQEGAVQHDAAEVGREPGRGARGASGGRAPRPVAHEGPELFEGALLHLGDRGQHPAPVEGLGGGGVDRPRLDGGVHVGAALHEDHAGPAEPEFAGQHEPDGAAARHHHVRVRACAHACVRVCAGVRFHGR